MVTNEHKLSGLKQHKYVFFEFCRLEVGHNSHEAKIKMPAWLHSSRCSRGESGPSFLLLYVCFKETDVYFQSIVLHFSVEEPVEEQLKTT